MDRPVNPQLLAKRLRFYVGRALGLTSTFERWQQENPDKGFSDFFGETAKRKLAKGEPLRASDQTYQPDYLVSREKSLSRR